MKMYARRINSHLRQASFQDKRDTEDISIWWNYWFVSFSIGAQQVISVVKPCKNTGKAFIRNGQWELASIHWNINIWEVLAFIINAPNFLRYFRVKKTNKKNNKIQTLSQYTAMKISSKQM